MKAVEQFMLQLWSFMKADYHTQLIPELYGFMKVVTQFLLQLYMIFMKADHTQCMLYGFMNTVVSAVIMVLH